MGPPRWFTAWSPPALADDVDGAMTRSAVDRAAIRGPASP
jgi:hypothetical protein